MASSLPDDDLEVEMSIQQTFAHNMRTYRVREGLSQEALAERCGLHRTYIGNIEQKSSNITLETVQKIAMALDVSPSELLLDTPDLDSDASDMGLAVMPATQDQGNSRYALCTWSEGEEPEFVPIDVRNEDLTLRILCALVQEGYADDLAKAYERVQEPILRYLQSIKRSEYPKDFLLETFEKDVQKSTPK